MSHALSRRGGGTASRCSLRPMPSESPPDIAEPFPQPRRSATPSSRNGDVLQRLVGVRHTPDFLNLSYWWPLLHRAPRSAFAAGLFLSKQIANRNHRHRRTDPKDDRSLRSACVG